MLRSSFPGRWLFWVALACLAVAWTARAQSPATIADQLSTAEHVKKRGWWPTKGSAPRDEYVGATQCAACHSDIAATQKTTHMAQTAMPAALSELLKSQEKIDFSQPPFAYLISRSGAQENYSVSNGTETISDPLTWAFGTGNNGQSYLLTHQGKLYEARLSYYAAYKKFAITPNHPAAPAESLEKAIGRRISDDEAQKCFACHTQGSTTKDKFDPAQAIGGITCEVCHGPGATHVAAQKSGLAESGVGFELNPAHLSPAESVDFCGACHRTWWDVTLAGLSGIGTLRFPAYRLEKSRCWGTGDARVTCIACHDPHQPLVRDAASYDSRCLNCHLASVGAKADASHPGAACPVSTKECTSCHMPKYEVPDMKTKFTDHMIRVARKDGGFPE